MAHVIVLGAGAMGLAAAHHLLKAGHTVELFEADRVAGGMAAHFDFGGLSIERGRLREGRGGREDECGELLHWILTGSGTNAGVCLPWTISSAVSTSFATALDGSHTQPAGDGRPMPASPLAET